MFYTLKNDEQCGPYSEAQLKAMWANGSVTADVLCWREGMAEWMPVDAVLGEPAQDPPEIEVMTTEGSETPSLNGKELIPSGSIRRFSALVIDYAAILALAYNFPIWIGCPEDPQHGLIASFILVACVILKDSPFHGRSLGRLLTGCYLIDLPESKPATLSKSVRRNAAQALWLFGLFPLLFLMDWLFKSSNSDIIKILIGLGSMVMPIVILVYLITIAMSFNNPTGQGVWDVPFKTCVMNKKKR
ncbi:MAG: DUF4339 domain-containing protein [Prosthecobacter sp.]|nr:DUF4339 domain-containing protein [Prosthecobacter sp.]